MKGHLAIKDTTINKILKKDMSEYRLMPARRSYTRFKLETEGRLLSEDKEIHIDCWDFSGRGLGAFSNVPLPINNKVKTEFSLPWTN